MPSQSHYCISATIMNSSMDDKVQVIWMMVERHYCSRGAVEVRSQEQDPCKMSPRRRDQQINKHELSRLKY